jgi:hypothetical protein
MWVVDIRFWRGGRDLGPLERSKLYTATVDEWIERQGDRPGFDVFDDEGAFVLDEAEAAIRRGERW